MAIKTDPVVVNIGPQHPSTHGVFRMRVTLDGEIITEGEWRERRDEWLPSGGDADFIDSLMKPVSEPGQFAGWIAPPKVGIDNKPGEFEYVKIEV